MPEKTSTNLANDSAVFLLLKHPDRCVIFSDGHVFWKSETNIVPHLADGKFMLCSCWENMKFSKHCHHFVFLVSNGGFWHVLKSWEQPVEIKDVSQTAP